MTNEGIIESARNLAMAANAAAERHNLTADDRLAVGTMALVEVIGQAKGSQIATVEHLRNLADLLERGLIAKP